MPTMRQHKSSKLLRIMGMGDSGTGKTGSLVEVVNHMDELGLAKVVIQDYDDGLDILRGKLKEEYLERVFFETLRDEMKGAVPQKNEPSGAVVRGDPTAWINGMALLNWWKVSERKDPDTGEIIPAYDIGSANSWGADTLLVTDTITGMGDAAMNYVQWVDPSLNTWKATGKAMVLQDSYTQMVISLRCNVIMFSHERYMGGGGTIAIDDTKHQGVTQIKEADSDVDGKCYPSALGRNLPKQINRHFNYTLEWRIVGTGRTIATKPDERISLKCPLDLPDYLDQKTGLYELFTKARNI